MPRQATADELALIVHEILKAAPELHWRRCHDCQTVALHAQPITPYVLCRNCGSQDTRHLKALAKLGELSADEAATSNPTIELTIGGQTGPDPDPETTERIKSIRAGRK